MKKKILLLLLFIGLVAPGYCLTLSQLKTEIRIRIKDSDTTRRRYTDTQLLNFINEAQRDVVNYTWVVKKSTSIELVSGTTYYSFPTDFINVQRVSLRKRNLRETSLEQLDSQFSDGDWESTGGYPQKYFQDPARPDYIGLFPWPNSSTSTGTLKINYFAEPTDLSSDSDLPFGSEDRYANFHDLLIYFPCYKVYLTEGEIDKASAYKALYDEKLAIAAAQIGSNPNFRPGFGADRK